MGGGFGLFLPLIVIGGMMFFMTRSQKKQQKERQNVLDAMAIGDKVVTIGGLHGVIAEINTEKNTVVLDCEGIFLEFNRTAISSVKPGETVVAPVEVEEVAEVIETEATTETEATKED